MLVMHPSGQDCSAVRLTHQRTELPGNLSNCWAGGFCWAKPVGGGSEAVGGLGGRVGGGLGAIGELGGQLRVESALTRTIPDPEGAGFGMVRVSSDPSGSLG